jgi:hypothetical protein
MSFFKTQLPVFCESVNFSLKNIPHPGLWQMDRFDRMSTVKRGDRMELKKTVLQVTEKDEKLIRMIRELKFGEVHIYIADGQPVRAEEIKKSIKF